MSRTNLPSLLLLLVLALFSPIISGFASGQEPSPGFNTPWRNADGSPKLALEFAGGYDDTVAAARSHQNAGWNLRLGGGYRFSRRFAALLEYNYDHLRIPNVPLISYYTQSVYYGDGGTTHLWSATLEPTFEYFETEHFGAYVVGGGGFYRQIQNSTGVGTRATDNAGGANLGLEFARRISDRNNAKFIVGARYVWVDSPTKPYMPATQFTVPGLTTFHNSYVPVEGGFRW